MKIKDLIAEIFLVICIVFTIGGAINTCTKDTKLMSSPVEDTLTDSLILENDKLIIEINNLDSIKDVEIIEVKSLNNDSTLKLFYKLIRE